MLNFTLLIFKNKVNKQYNFLKNIYLVSSIQEKKLLN